MKKRAFLIPLTALCWDFASSHVGQHDDCGTPIPQWDMRDDDDAEISMFGKRVRHMTRMDLSSMFRAMKGKLARSSELTEDSIDNTMYQLIGMPIVYHILPNQDNGGVGRPSLTSPQRDFATNQTNKLFSIYDKLTKTSVQFSTFITDRTIVHDDVKLSIDCNSLSAATMESIVKTADEWEYKFHVIVCETTAFSGKASFPRSYEPTSALHNSIRVDYRAFACYDEEGNFLCDLADGKKVSHTRWWRTRSTVVAHEFGHLLGLQHTFTGSSCQDSTNDGVSDTPALSTSSTSGCPGLLPYDKDRDLYSRSIRSFPNEGGNATTCLSGSSGVCGSTCAACCNPGQVDAQCTKYSSENESVSEDVNKFLSCCDDPTPLNTCLLRPGVDPLNNVMSYIPDYCSFEFTPGQMAKMMSQVLTYKDYIYCNYANVADSAKCADIPCASVATSPNCVKY